MSKLGKSAILAAGSAIACLANSADAVAHENNNQNSNYPYVSGHLDLKVHTDNIFNAQDSENEVNDVYSHSHLDLTGHINKNFSINTRAKYEGHSSAQDHHHGPEGDDQYFNNHELYIETLTIDFDNEYGALYAGKFNPVIGISYHDIPGIWGYQEVEGYSILERVGVGGAAKFDAGNFGKHRVDLSTFFADTTFLSDSLVNQRGHTQEKDGGVSNTEDFSSYSASLGGEEFNIPDTKVLDGFSYRLGYAKQAKGVGDSNDETRYSVGGGYEFKITDEVKAKVMAEFADIRHLGGDEEHDREYTTVAAAVYYQGWNAATSHTFIDNTAGVAGHNHDGSATQVSAGYQFDNGIGIDAGYKTADIDNQDRDTVGMMLTYSYSF